MKAKAPLIVFLLFCALSGYLFFKLMEPFSEMQDDGWSRNAQRNPYLAAEIFLQKTGKQVVATHDFQQIDNLPANGTIFISDVRKVLTHKRLEMILEWIHAGGHVIVAAPVHDKNNPDPLLSYFKVENHLHEIKKLSAALEAENINIKTGKKNGKKDKIAVIKHEDITYLEFQDVPYKVRINFSSSSYLTHPALTDAKYKMEPLYELSYVARNDDGVHFLQLYYGDGLLSILSDQAIWQSASIDKLDHAYLLWLLSENSDQVIMLYGAQMASIFFYLGKYAPEMISGLAVLVLAWLFYRGRRFGKIMPPLNMARRSLAEHIQASSQYYWRQGDMNALVEPVRKELARRLAIALPGINDVAQADRIKMIAEHTNISSEQVTLALHAVISANENDYIKVMTHLQLLRNAI